MRRRALVAVTVANVLECPLPYRMLNEIPAPRRSDRMKMPLTGRAPDWLSCRSVSGFLQLER